jgi:hypothetical protein
MYGDLQGIAGKAFQEIEGLAIPLLEVRPVASPPLASPPHPTLPSEARFGSGDNAY